MPLANQIHVDSLKELKGVEIFSAGKWNGDEYSVADLDEMIRAYNDTSATCKPALKLGHDDNQNILQADGYPAAGWIGKLYRSGEKLLADFIDIPEKIYQLLEKRAYRNVSSEIYWDADVNGKKYGKMLAAVALLGADMPAVSNLKDILSLYTKMNFSEKFLYTEPKVVPTIKLYSFTKEATMPEELQKIQDELAAEKAKLAALEVEATAAKTAQSDQAKELETLKAYKADADKRLAELEAKAKDAETEVKSVEVCESVKASPAMKPYIKALLGDEKKTYKLGDKEESRSEVLKNLLSLHAEALKLNTKEQTIDGDAIVQSKLSGNETDKVEKHAQENKISFSQAYKELYRGKLKNKG